jgi:small subunit ribosomal protein S1
MFIKEGLVSPNTKLNCISGKGIRLIFRGDTLKAIVINVSAKDRKIGLSVKTLEGDDEEVAVEKFKKAEKVAAESAPSTFGDLLKAAAEGNDSADND